VDAACEVEPCTSLAVASRVFNDLAALDWSYPPDCYTHIRTVLPVVPTSSSLVRMAGGVDVQASAVGFCRVVEITEPWRNLVRYGLTFAIVGLVFVAVVIRRYRGLAGGGNG
jgi:cystathionine beta-lyase family protein involved in aluminum resistance